MPKKVKANFSDASFASVRFPVEAGHGFNGRNGYCLCTGIEVYLAGSASTVNGLSPAVRLTPFTSRKVLAESTYLEVSADPKVLRELAEILTDVANQVELRQQHNSTP